MKAGLVNCLSKHDINRIAECSVGDILEDVWEYDGTPVGTVQVEAHDLRFAKLHADEILVYVPDNVRFIRALLGDELPSTHVDLETAIAWGVDATTLIEHTGGDYYGKWSDSYWDESVTAAMERRTNKIWAGKPTTAEDDQEIVAAFKAVQ